MTFDFISRKFACDPLQRNDPEEPALWEEGGDCPLCGGQESLQMAYPEGGCSCHISAPCGRCTSSFLACADCGEVEP